MSEDTYRPITITPDNGPMLDIAAAIELAAVNSRRPDSAHWTELQLLKTRAGAYVCVEYGHSIIDHQHTRTQAGLAGTIEQVIDFFGQRWLAKKLYEEAGIDLIIKVA